MAAAAVTLAAALISAQFGLALLFERHVERRVQSELEADIRQLIAGLSVTAQGVPRFDREPSDQRYAQTFSGKYWQVELDQRVVAKSRSLWDTQMQLPLNMPDAGELHQHRLQGPRGRSLLVVERCFLAERTGTAHRFCVAAAVDDSEVYAAVDAFRTDLAIALTILGALLFAAFATAVYVGIGPLNRLRTALASLRAGDERRLEGRFPEELAPLVDDLNRVLDQRARTAQQAKLRAADLAHGLKTPLTAIEVVADELRGKGEAEVGAELSGYVSTMRRHVERELALARSAVTGEPGKTIVLSSAVEHLVSSLRRISNGKELAWNIRIAPALAIKIDDALLMEVLGNLLDNARKWARSRVDISARRRDGYVEIGVDDDGSGVAEDQLEVILGRGRRLDASVPGTGFGLAIVHDMLEQAGGSITLERSSMGGLGVRVLLPVQG